MHRDSSSSKVQRAAGRSAEPGAVAGDSIRLRGRVTFTMLDEQGKVVDEQVVHNLIVTAGKDAILNPTGTKYVKEFGYLAIGDGTNVPTSSDTALQHELARSTSAVIPTFSSHVLTFVETYAAGVGTGTIQEGGLFSASSGGTMFSRLTCAPMEKGETNTLQVTYQIY